MLEMMSSVFLGATEPAALGHFLRASAALATSITTYRAQVPAGLEALREGLRRDLLPQISNTTSKV
jgi:hypothetical protein